MQRLILRLAGTAVWTFYRHTPFGGSVPSEGPVLLVGNHPNGLVDPVVLASATDRPVRFLGKAPLFDMPVIGTLVRGMGTLPVYRAQDGADTAQNEETFRAVFDALRAGDLVCIFPEGISHSEPALQKLKTGAARMALGAEAREGFQLGLRIVPVGLVYRSKRRFRSKVATWIGEPIAIGDLQEAYSTDDRSAVHALTERIADGLRQVTLDLDRWEDLPLLELAETIWHPGEGRRLARLHAFAEGLRSLRETHPKRIDELAFRISCFRDRLRRLGMTAADLDVRYSPVGVLRFCARTAVSLVLGLPLGLAGVLFWFVPYRLVPLIASFRKPSRDTFATVHILAALLVFPVWWLAAAALAGSFGVLWFVLTLVATPFLGLFALAYLEWRAQAMADASVFLRVGLRAKLKHHLVRQRDELVAEIDRLREELREAP